MKFKKIVISASRRTDIPAFYMESFMAAIDRGVFKVANPFNRKVSMVPSDPEHVHCIVFWSKNFGPFIRGEFGESLQKRGYHLFFNFSINSRDRVLEPGVPPLDVRLSQLESLCKRFGPRAVTWRFDPICFYTHGSEARKDNLGDFSRISEVAAGAGIERCITSFLDLYKKVEKRSESLAGFRFLIPRPEQKADILKDLARRLARKNIRLYTCCEGQLLSAIRLGDIVRPASCVPNHLLTELFGEGISVRKDRGQRLKQGCGCGVSVDIGDYLANPCFHNCLFCYANPSPPPSGVNRDRG